jgi:hypothetical protein
MSLLFMEPHFMILIVLVAITNLDILRIYNIILVFLYLMLLFSYCVLPALHAVNCEPC